MEPASSHTDHDKYQQIQFEQLRLLYKPTLLVAFSYAIAALVLVASQWELGYHHSISFWLCALFAIISFRVITYIRFRKANPNWEDSVLWNRLFLTGTLAAGITWGSASILLFPDGDPLHQIMLLMVLSGMSAGSTTTLSPKREASLPFLLLLLLPINYQLLTESSYASQLLGGMTLYFIIFLIGSALQNYQTHKENITLRIESSEREKTLRKSEHKLQLSEEKFRTLTEDGSDIVSTINRDGVISYLSPSIEPILGYLPAELTGKNVFSLLHKDDNESIKDSIRDIFKHPDQSIHIEFRVLHKNGSWHLLEANGRITNSANGNLLILNSRDTTAHKELEMQLRQSQKLEAIGTLVGGIAHNFNNALAAMQGNIYLARLSSKNNPDLQKRLNILEKLGDRSAEMIKQLLAFARKDRVSMAPVHMNKLLGEEMSLLHNTLPENIEHHCHICPQQMTIMGDSSLLQQSLINLFINARDAVADVSYPVISCSLEHYLPDEDFYLRHPDNKGKSFARLCIQDNGHGISDEDIDKIFEPFFTTKEVGKGSGLGLAMLYGAIQTHHGVIDVESKHGKGTTFHIYLPLIEGDADNSLLETNSPTIIHGNGETILLVDDNSAILDASREVLISLGYKVYTASNGEEALSVFESEKISLLVSDLIMPKIGGFKLGLHIRKQNENLPIIFATGYDRDILNEPELENSIILNKPFSVKELSQAIHSLLH